MALHRDETFLVTRRSMSFCVYLHGGRQGSHGQSGSQEQSLTGNSSGLCFWSRFCSFFWHLCCPRSMLPDSRLNYCKASWCSWCSWLNAATTTSVLTAVGVHGLKRYCFVCERNKSPPSRLFSRSEIKDDITRWRGFDANTHSLSFSHCESRWCKQRWQRHFSRTLSPPHAEPWPHPSCICHFFGSLLTQRSCQRSA